MPEEARSPDELCWQRPVGAFADTGRSTQDRAASARPCEPPRPAAHARGAELLLHPVVLVALAVWIGNDHVAKAAWPGAVTGKLSDLAGLVVFPLVPVVALDLWRQRRGLPAPGPSWAAGWLAATAAALIAIKLFDPAAWAYRHGLALVQYPLLAMVRLLAGGELPPLRPVRLAMDPSDLLTLPALLVPWLLLRWRQPPGQARPSRRRFGFWPAT